MEKGRIHTLPCRSADRALDPPAVAHIKGKAFIRNAPVILLYSANSFPVLLRIIQIPEEEVDKVMKLLQTFKWLFRIDLLLSEE